MGAFSILYCSLGAVYTLTGMNVVDLSNWDVKIIWSNYVGQTKFNLFMRGQNNAVNFEEITLTDHIGTVFFVTLKCFNQICSHFIGNGFLILSLLLHHMSRDFQELLQTNDEKISTVRNSNFTM